MCNFKDWFVKHRQLIIILLNSNSQTFKDSELSDFGNFWNLTVKMYTPEGEFLT